MELVARLDFEHWLETVGIQPDARFPKANVLTFSAAPDARSVLPLPTGPTAFVGFVEWLFALAAPEERWYCCPWQGHWAFATPGGPWKGEAIEVVARGLGIPMSHDGAIDLGAVGMSGVLALAVSSLVFGWGVGEDLYFVPASGSVLLKTSHHGEIIAHFPSVEARARLLDQLAARGFATE
jgi:hypothetical protein